MPMVRPEDRLWCQGGYMLGTCLGEDPTDPVVCDVWDWDQLRMIRIKGTAKVFPPDKGIEIQILGKFVDYLSPEVRAVTVDDEGLITGVSTDPEEDQTLYTAFIPFSMTTSLHDCRTIQHSKLQELDRLFPGVDLSSYHDEVGSPQKVVFKFTPIHKTVRLRMAWDELHVLNAMPSHPNILPLDRIVVEDVESRILGFTTKFIPGGNLEESKLPIRLEWLKQLTELVDFLNLNLGVMHQDIAPRNLLIDPETGKILLFDFDRVARGKYNLMEGRDDVTGVVFTLYELITGDDHFGYIPHWEKNMDMVQTLSEWPCNRELDAEVSTFRSFLDQWVKARSFGADIDRYLNAPQALTWPDMPRAPDDNVLYETWTYPNGEKKEAMGAWYTRDAVKNGQYVFRWQRPPQSRLKKDENSEV